MAVEKFANLAETFLAGAYAGGGGVITVTDPSLFPTSGLFRIRLGNSFRTILIVTAVAGASFTTVAEFNDGPASTGTGIVLVATRGSHERFLQSPESDADIQIRAGISGADLYIGPIWRVTPLDQAAWNWFNQGSASVVQANGLVYLITPSAGGTNIRGRLQGSYPTPPFTLTVGILPFFQEAGSISNLNILGIAISDGTKFKVLVAANFNFNTTNAPSAIWVGKYNTFSAAVSATVAVWQLRTIVWLRVVDDGVDQFFYFSMDKVNWILLLQEARTTHLTPSDIGIVVTNQSGSFDSGGDIVSWELT